MREDREWMLNEYMWIILNTQNILSIFFKGSILHCPYVVSDKEESTVTINCHLNETFNVKWYFGTTTYSQSIAEIENGIKSVADEQLYDINSNATLIIKDLRHQQEGFYTVEYYYTYDGRTEQSTVVIEINGTCKIITNAVKCDLGLTCVFSAIKKTHLG